MNAPLNLVCFSQEHWKTRAKGFDLSAWYGKNIGQQNGGIFRPSEADLELGQTYYRFVSSTNGSACTDGALAKGIVKEWFAGEWWITKQTFSHMCRFARAHELSLENAARYFLAVPYEWSRMDRVICATLALPIRAYVGEGKPVFIQEQKGKSNNVRDKWIPPQQTKVKQIYIPGLRQNSDVRDLYKTVWENNAAFYTASLKKL